MEPNETTPENDFETLVGMPANAVAALAMRTMISVMEDSTASSADRLRAAGQALEMLEQMRSNL